jgi:hypothetical protein
MSTEAADVKLITMLENMMQSRTEKDPAVASLMDSVRKEVLHGVHQAVAAYDTLIKAPNISGVAAISMLIVLEGLVTPGVPDFKRLEKDVAMMLMTYYRDVDAILKKD